MSKPSLLDRWTARREAVGRKEWPYFSRISASLSRNTAIFHRLVGAAKTASLVLSRRTTGVSYCFTKHQLCSYRSNFIALYRIAVSNGSKEAQNL